MMKVRYCIPVLLLASFAVSLDTPASQPTPATTPVVVPPQARRPSPASSKQGRLAAMRGVAANVDVISINGVCPAGSEKHRECKTSVTRAQFEELLSVLPRERENPGPQMSPQAKRQFALQYSNMLMFAAEAEKQGLQDTPETRELLRYARLQVLAQVLTHQLKGTTPPTLEEIKKYYADNQDHFVELTLQRVFIPVHQLADGKTNEAEMRLLADDLRQRAATVDGFGELQSEANKKADIKNPPETRIVLPSTALPATQQAVLQLKLGELSPVIQDASGFYVYKLEGSKPLPLEMQMREIQEKLTELKLRQQIDKVLSASKPVLNPQYFQQGTAAASRSAHGSIAITPQPPFKPALPVSTSLSK